MRYLTPLLEEIISKERKMAFIAGPRQVGKTTLSRSFLAEGRGYFNWDIERDRQRILKDPSQFWREESAEPTRIALDEIHKYPRWKKFLKGLYDDVGKEIEILVTGSGRLDVYQKGGDSLFGRYGLARLHPFTVGEYLSAERRSVRPPQEALEALLHHKAPRGATEALDLIERFGGFPEPLFAASETRLSRWRRAHRELILREDLRDLTRIREVGLIDALVALLPERVSSPLSLNSLREDLGVAFGTVQLWLQALARLYYLLEIRPYAARLARTLRREGKVYLFDITSVENAGARFENLMALHLRKACDAWSDWGYGDFELHYVRDKEKREVDFLILENRKPFLLVECKHSETAISKDLVYFTERLKPRHSFQVVRSPSPLFALHRRNQIILCTAAHFLAFLP